MSLKDQQWSYSRLIFTRKVQTISTWLHNLNKRSFDIAVKSTTV